MALLQDRHGIGTVYTISGLILSITIFIICTETLSVNGFMTSGQEKSKGPDPLIRFVTQPKQHVIIPSGSFVLLHCEANFTDYPNYEYESDDAMLPSEDDFMQNDGPLHQQPSVPILCAQDVQYQWLRNDKPIESNSTSIQIFCNGTIQIKHSPMATAIYRCVASTTRPEIGAVISKASNVKASVLERKISKLSSIAKEGSSVRLNCPIESVPSAKVLWRFNNETNIHSDRYFQLGDGSLLIVNVRNEDFGSFWCSAQNEYINNSSKQIQHSLEVTNSITTEDAHLFPPLQNKSLFVQKGSALTLHCAPTSTLTSKGNAIRWTFMSRSNNSASSEVQTSNPNKLHILNTSVEKNDGIYKCHFGDESQSFDVTITTPPVIQNAFSSREDVLGYFVKLVCNVTGNPKPNVQWYHNGKLIEYDWIVRYNETNLLINTFEEKHKGIYQCIATNVAGETQATGLLSLKPKTYSDPPKNPKCFPLNADTIKVIFDGPQNFKWSGITYYLASKYKPYWRSTIVLNHNTRIQNEFVFSQKPPFKPVMLFFRGMEKTGSDTRQKGGAVHYQFDMSRLSEGIKCATQGLPVFGMQSSAGIFVWWPKMEHENFTSFVIEFQSNETTAFSDVVGTTRIIDETQTWSDISGDLTNIPATTNVYPFDDSDEVSTQTAATDDKNTSPKMITKVRVSGNVTGILIPNKREIVVRVLVPIMDDEGELIQDERYVEWKKILNNLERMDVFKVHNIGVDRVTFQSTDPNVVCVRICYRRNGEKICEDRYIENSYVEVNSLSAFTAYKFVLSSCSGTKTFYNDFNIQTDHDIPGAVTNHTFYKQNHDIVIEWSAPTHPNGILKRYLVEWTIANKTYSEGIPYQSETDRNVFKFPDIQEGDRFNITIRAESNFGIGIPIYLDLRKSKDIPIGDGRNPWLGILIGVSLSILCIMACALIIIRHRKSRHHEHMNGNNGSTRSATQNRSPANRIPVANATTRISNSSSQIPANCIKDAHEMQTLIATSSTGNFPMTNGNGISKKLVDSHANGVIVAHSNRNNVGNTNSSLDNETEVRQLGLISSTPKSKHKTCIANNDHLKNISTNLGSYTAKAIDPAYRQIDYDVEALGTEPPTNVLGDGSMPSMKTMLPPNKSVHSIVFNEMKIPPTIKKANDDKAKTAKRTSNHMLNISIPSVFDDSQQSLLPDANATESSSESGSVPMDRISGKPNCLFDVQTFDNSAAQPIVENQRYMRSAALV